MELDGEVPPSQTFVPKQAPHFVPIEQYNQTNTFNLQLTPRSPIDELQVVSRLPKAYQAKAIAMAEKEQKFRHGFMEEEARHSRELQKAEAERAHQYDMRKLTYTAISEIGGKFMGFIGIGGVIASIVAMAFYGLYWQMGMALAGFFTLLLGVSRLFVRLMSKGLPSR